MDLDIDKISLLGLVFNRGKLRTWSRYMNLNSLEEFETSKRLPFPTGKVLEVLTENINICPYDVMRNDLTVTEGANGERIISSQKGNTIQVYGTPESKNGYTINISSENPIETFKSYPPLDQYTLLRNAISKIPEGAKVTVNFLNEDQKQAIGIINDIKDSSQYDYISDFKEFNNAITPGNENWGTPKQIQENIITYAPHLDQLIRVYNKLGFTTDKKIADIVNYHNTSLKGKARKDAAQNFISIRTKDISASPINQIQAQAAIDNQTDATKDILKRPEFQRLVAQTEKADRGSVYSKYFLLTLTLAGKENVGIVASSLKNFEALSQHTYQVLDEGTEEDQMDLLFNRVINGHKVTMIANAYARNKDTIKNLKVLEELEKVNNDKDAYLDESGLLSLATDNTKDPTLPKLNAGPEMISLYNSGVILGLSIEEVAKLALSDTGILLTNLCRGNVFNGQRGAKRLTQALQYIQRPPVVSFTTDQYNKMSKIFQMYQLLGSEDTLTKSKLDEIINNTRNGYVLNRIFKFLANPNENSSVFKGDLNSFIDLQITQLRNKKEYKKFSKRKQNILEELQNKQNLSEKEQNTLNNYKEYERQYIEIRNEIENWKKYKENPNDVTVLDTDALIALNNFINSQNETNIDSLKALRTELYNRSGFSNNIEQLLDWLRVKRVVENDYIEGYDGLKHKVINQIARLDEFSQEMSALRPMMALNQGLENKFEDQLNFVSNFGNIIQNRLDTIGSKALETFYDVQEKLDKLKEINDSLRVQGLIYNNSDYYLDLNSFIHNPEYNKLAKDIYGKIKFAVNILKVADEVNHYKVYLRLANLLLQMEKTASVVYRTASRIEDTIIPEMNARKKSHKDSIRKNILPAIYRKLNNNFIIEQKQQYIIPSFQITDGQIKLTKEGIHSGITLGTKGANQKFKDWIQYIEFPRWKREFSDNKFIQMLGYRTYDYNVDHNQSINMAKTRQYNMKNPSDVVEFDRAKADLQKLPSKVIDQLFYYNLITYNNSPGQLSLTDMFEDLIAANNFELIRNYNTFISNHETKDVDISEKDELKLEIAPVVPLYELKPSLIIPYLYVRDRNTGMTYLLQKQNTEQQNIYEDDYGFDNDFENSEINGKDSFMETINKAGYALYGSDLIDEAQTISTLKVGEYFFTNLHKLEDISLSYNNVNYSAKQILEQAKQAGFTKLEQIFPLTKGKKFNLSTIKQNLDIIFKEENKSC